MLVFSEQDVIKDPPFSRLDLISCRNLLIYLEGVLQQRLIELFHYALNPGGVLFLGTSESLGDQENLFTVVDRKWKLYQRKEDSYEAYQPKMGRLLPASLKIGPAPRHPWKTSGSGKLPLRELTARKLLQQYGAVGVLVNAHGDILYIHGRTGLYLEPAAGETSTNEELKSSKEELQSVNEELQSTNEELETSKEEMKSLNEELSTVNTELQQKVADLTQANNDINNLLAGTGVGTVFVDFDLNIKRFTPAATQLIHLIQSDIGRPVGHLASNLLGYNRLVEDVQAVLDSLVPREIEVQNRKGAWYVMRIHPYRTLENVIEGAVITFVEITEQKRVQKTLREAETLRRLAAIVRDVRDAVTMQDFTGRILAWSPGAERIYGWSEAEALDMNISDMVPEGSRKETLSMMRRLKKGETFEPMRVKRLTREGPVVDVWLTVSALVNKQGKPYAVSTIERKISEPNRAEGSGGGVLSAKHNPGGSDNNDGG